MIDVLGPEKRRRRTTQEKIAIVQQSFEPGMTVSLVARQHGVAASQLFLWRKQYQEGSPQLYVILRRTDDWMDGRRSRHTDEIRGCLCSPQDIVFNFLCKTSAKPLCKTGHQMTSFFHSLPRASL
ncbi:repressor TnpA [Escherichia coli]|nr:repressor TnpA [Escherichia coli]